jgi:DNA-binding response OmpR family regulator
MRILIAEDEKKLATFIERGLREAGFVVECVFRGDDAARLCLTGDFDAVVLDIMLPGRDGLDVLKEIRRRGSGVPIILLSARAGLEDRVAGLNLGADDYLPKPFSIEELVARVRALVRRSGGSSPVLLRVGDLTVDVMTRVVRIGEDEVLLSAREFALLELLARSPGRVFPRTQLLEKVWDYHFDLGSNMVEVTIGRLRRKLEPASAFLDIETVRGIGYRLRQV